MLELIARDHVLDDQDFAHRHIGPSHDELRAMVNSLGYDSVAEFIAAAVPPEIRTQSPLALPPSASEPEVVAQLRELAGRNRILTSMLGQGYYPTHVPAVILRNVLENPAWYTAYTPYQPEISQGRLTLLLAFQTMISDLTGLPVANASMLDEATAAAEAVSVMHRTTKLGPGAVLVVDDSVWQHTQAVLHTRAEPMGIAIVSAALTRSDDPGAELDRVLAGRSMFGAVVQYPGADGALRPLAPICAAVAARGAQTTVATDLLALTLL
ncbi:MAG: glycine dehydrogenase (aminomethyl-transferring), partial [Angustibacter sp.]